MYPIPGCLGVDPLFELRPCPTPAASGFWQVHLIRQTPGEIHTSRRVAVRWRRFNLGLELGEFQGGAFGPGVNEGATFGGQGEALFGAHGAFRAAGVAVPPRVVEL